MHKAAFMGELQHFETWTVASHLGLRQFCQQFFLEKWEVKAKSKFWKILKKMVVWEL